MAYLIDVDYYNSFWLKRTSSIYHEDLPIWPSIPDNVVPPDYPEYPQDVDIASDQNWYIEETRIKGGFNNNFFQYGNRAYANLDDSLQKRRQSSLIYSGPYNPTFNFNQTNVFSVGEQITRSLDPANGSIQKTFAEDTNLTIFQESKVSQALIDKDAIYSAEGQGQPVSTRNLVIGQIVPYLGKYGIGKNPESFANFGMRKYFVDPNNNTVMRLSRDGLTEISRYGMKDYFRDTLSIFNNNQKSFQINWETLSSIPSPNVPTNSFVIEGSICNIYIGMKILTLDTVTGDYQNTGATIDKIEVVAGSPVTYRIVCNKDILLTPTGGFLGNYKSKAMGAWDNYSRYYVLSIQETPRWVDVEPTFENTIKFDEDVKGWVSFFSYKPENMFSLEGTFYSTINKSVYQHYLNNSDNANYGNFYGIQYKGNIIFVFNDKPSTKKVFQTVNYEGNNGWQVDYIIGSSQKFDYQDSIWGEFFDQAQFIYSYNEGTYYDVNGQPRRAGFDRKENLYVAKIVGTNSVANEQVISPLNLTGIKGYFATVSISTDATTNPGGEKELWSVGSTIVQSS